MTDDVKVVLLRTLTLKSILGYRYYPEKTVGEFLENGYVSVLIYHYYCVQNITFTENILKLIGITEDVRIEKPGINVAFFEKSHGRFNKPIIRAEHIEAEYKNKIYKPYRNTESKLSMMGKNHGKKY